MHKLTHTASVFVNERVTETAVLQGRKGFTNTCLEKKTLTSFRLSASFLKDPIKFVNYYDLSELTLTS